MNTDDHNLPCICIERDVLITTNVNACLDAVRAQMRDDLTPAERFAIEFQIAAISWHMARRALTMAADE
jgi:hypothetical protein